tara:strand:- start:1072 stop:1479 length:408 start_codon:yes stop_codon:yes gene_type:complete
METKQEELGQVEKFTRIFIKIRDVRAAAKAEFDKEDKRLKEQQDKIKGTLLDYCKEQGVESVKTGSGMFYRSVKTRYWTSDWEAMHAFIKEKDLHEFMEKRLNQTAVREYLEDNPDAMPEGLNIDSEYQLSVRKK